MLKKIGLFSITVFSVTCALAMVDRIQPANAEAGCMFAGTLYPVGAQACQAGLMYICNNSGNSYDANFVWAPVMPQQNC